MVIPDIPIVILSSYLLLYLPTSHFLENPPFPRWGTIYWNECGYCASHYTTDSSYCPFPHFLCLLRQSSKESLLSYGFYFSPSFPPLESVCPFSWPLPHAHICKFKSGFWMWEKRYGICCSESDFFHLTWCSPSPSIFLTMWFHFSLWLNRIASVYDCHIFYIFICQWTSRLVTFLFKINFYYYF